MDLSLSSSKKKNATDSAIVSNVPNPHIWCLGFDNGPGATIIKIKRPDAKGDFIRFTNRLDTDIDISGWILYQCIDAVVQKPYTFRLGTVIKAKATITVWSVHMNVPDCPPDNILMGRNWGTGRIVATKLVGNQLIAYRNDKYVTSFKSIFIKY